MKSRSSLLPASSYWLIAANVAPLAGVLLFGWSTFAIVMIYWCENVVIGVINVLKMICCCPDPAAVERELQARAESPAKRELAIQLRTLSKSAGLMHHVSKAFMIPFFAFHYGMFCMVHGIFVVALLGGDEGMQHMSGSPLTVYGELFARAGQEGLWWAVLVLAISHLFSFCTNFILGGEYRRTLVPQLMMQPYGRIVVLHLAILFGAFATMALGSPIFILVLLVVGKTALDLKFHLRERRKNAE